MNGALAGSHGRGLPAACVGRHRCDADQHPDGEPDGTPTSTPTITPITPTHADVDPDDHADHTPTADPDADADRVEQSDGDTDVKYVGHGQPGRKVIRVSHARGRMGLRGLTAGSCARRDVGTAELDVIR